MNLLEFAHLSVCRSYFCNQMVILSYLTGMAGCEHSPTENSYKPNFCVEFWHRKHAIS